MSNISINKISKEARMEATSMQFASREEITPLHIHRYNTAIKRSLETKDINEDEVDGKNVTWEQFFAARNRKVEAFNNCIQSMIQKETLLQFHNPNFVIDINIEHSVKFLEKRKKEGEFNVELLTFDELKRMYEYYKKVRLGEDEVLGIIQANTDTQTKIEDIGHEEIEEANIKAIKLIELPVPVRPNQPATNCSNQILREKLQMIEAAKAFKKAGMTLTDEEEELIN